ncbi:glycerophosphodiester phosphodiesterase family protein [soil metagenome]
MKKIWVLIIFVSTALTSCKTPAATQQTMLPAFDKEGHRGCRGLMPENTIAAMLKAIDLGVTTLEMDISFTQDGVAILSHEPFFNHEITTTPDGSFVKEQEERQLNIFKMTYAETQRYDVGLKPHPRFPKQEKIAAKKPALKDLITTVENYTKEKKLPAVFYNIETKTIPLTDNIFHPAPAEFVKMLMKVINEKGISNRTIIQSFDFRTLQIIHKDYPAIKTAMLIEDFDKRTLEEQLTALGFTPTIYSPEYSLVTASLVAACHAKNIKVIPWTVDYKLTIDLLKNLGVDGIITDYPNLFNK